MIQYIKLNFNLFLMKSHSEFGSETYLHVKLRALFWSHMPGLTPFYKRFGALRRSESF